MARDGSGNYTRPGGTTAVTGQTITASLWETMMSDLESDANVDRPVAAGGTGASTAAGAQTNLGLDKTLGIIAGPTMITATDTSYSLDADVEHVEIWAIGAGGAGGGADGNGSDVHTACGSGGAGGALFHLRVDTTASTISITIGAGGTGSAGADGGDGGDTVVVLDSVTYTAPGGGGGTGRPGVSNFDYRNGAEGGIGTAAGNEIHYRGHEGGESQAQGEGITTGTWGGFGGRGGGGFHGRGGGKINRLFTNAATVVAGQGGKEYGAGGAGGVVARSASGTSAGGNGASGAVLLIQYGKTT